MVVCQFCGKPITKLPKYINQVMRCSCGSQYYIEVGDESDIIEGITDFFDVIDVKALGVKHESEKIVVEFMDRKAIAVMLQEPKYDDPESFGLGIWVVFIK